MLREFRLAPLSGGAPHSVVMFLHGLGDRGDGGLLSIGQYWQRALPHTEFLCPDAPFPFDMAPSEFGGRQWFSLQDRDYAKLESGVRQAVPILKAYIDHVLATRHLPPEKLALVGFSQGTMMALFVAPRRDKQIACVVGYSGLLRGGAELVRDKKSSPPVLLVHGTDDDVVAYSELAAAERGLRAADIPVSTVTCPGLGHSIDERGMAEGLHFLQQHLS